VSPLFEAENVELVDLTYQKGPGGWTLCFYIDIPGGVTLAECEKWSKKLESVLDASDAISHSYSLEVSSPGLNRPLKKLKDFERFKGERVYIKLFAPIDGQKNFHGILAGATESIIQLKMEDQREIELPRSQVAKSQLDPIYLGGKSGY